MLLSVGVIAAGAFILNVASWEQVCGGAELHNRDLCTEHHGVCICNAVTHCEE
uniref:Uncharacterized protein n=1 Tax=Anguilla anguilla TaxID=7936 RepID=A0A0E9QXU0_ANGAN